MGSFHVNIVVAILQLEVLLAAMMMMCLALGALCHLDARHAGIMTGNLRADLCTGLTGAMLSLAA